MSDRRIGVGIVGANPEGSWAAMAHVPAVKALPQFDLVAVSTTRIESAKAAGEAFGVAKVYTHHVELIADSEVDLVVVAVRVPYHRDIVLTALAAGKNVYCEWPLGHGLAESQELMEAEAKSAGRGFIGTQAVAAPAFCYLKDLLADGYVGQVQSVSIVASGMAWGGFVDQANLYSVDESIGATMLTIPFGHMMSALDPVVGLPTEVTGRIEYRRKQAVVIETGETVPMSSPDQVLMHGVLESGAPISAHFRGGMAKGTNLLIEINGSEGDLQLNGLCGHVQMFPVSISGARGADQELQLLPVPPQYLPEINLTDGLPLGVAYAYQAVAADLLEGRPGLRDFAGAIRVHRLIDAIERSAKSGRREVV